MLEKPEIEGFEGKKRTKMPILCSAGAKTREKSPFLTQKCQFCAREGSVLSGKMSEEVPHCESEVYLYNGVEQGAPMLFVRGGEEEHIYAKEAFVPT